jgi:hypothetical protein
VGLIMERMVRGRIVSENLGFLLPVFIAPIPRTYLSSRADVMGSFETTLSRDQSHPVSRSKEFSI